MARGWESKSVEAQIEDAKAASDARVSGREELEAEQQRASLERSRRRVLGELKATTSELRRTALQNALDFLDEQIRKLPPG